MTDDVCCTCGGGKGYMAAPKGSEYEGLWVCAGCEKPRRLYFDTIFARAHDETSVQEQISRQTG